MKTDDFISLLATGVKPVDRHLARKLFAQAIAMGGAGALLLTLLVFGVRHDLALMLTTPLFWLKLAFPLALATSALLVLVRLARPGAVVGRRVLMPLAPLLVIWALALVALALAPAASRYDLIMGTTWKTCPFNITLLSIPGAIALVRAVRQLAPTQLRMAGMFTGLLAGSVATVAYCLHCPEMGVPFWGVWYLAGILIPTLLGALAGPRLLRW